MSSHLAVRDASQFRLPFCYAALTAISSWNSRNRRNPSAIRRMELTMMIDDPKAYVKPWMVTIPLALRADTELIESFCEGQERHNQLRRIEPAPPEPPSPPMNREGR